MVQLVENKFAAFGFLIMIGCGPDSSTQHQLH
jgi:hypothetical protein